MSTGKIISKRIVLVPHRMKFTGGPDDLLIRMQSGISFGRGDHPTTRLGLRGIEYVFEDTAFSGSCGINSTVLDIGAGTGVLAIACVLSGQAGQRALIPIHAQEKRREIMPE